MSETAPAPATPTRLRTVLIVVIAIAALVIAAGGGWLLRGGDDDDNAKATGPTAVDLGFTQDMITHHVQAVTMAGVERDRTASKSLHSLAFDIETSQQFQVGEMSGWLDGWDEGRNNAHPMAWMGHEHMVMSASGLMPGMATPAQLDKLVRVRGTELDKLFLQLMIRHHQGALPMARYALAHGNSGYVRDLAQSVISSQSTEIVQMEQQLRALGGRPLPPPQS
ncbi:Uncharacterized conserved protein, DUF305 family [Jatrophihabitans endophyticus]|uniref:Uncharacterized conserved protein, DUF305 family n=1 Tax=Jatrophihabitans endophyticus TaxID=1206085 RepID=A0A1M5DME0_9ACTN|nr:DUF305 domain-containing protein [Jatrophihabitans endophyticus]SHF68065.1 Uncharacterized conserved protein, DUF305 family [Jatrophihabitans endophyticus]